MRVRRPMIQSQPDLGGARDESSSRPFGHGGVNTPGTHLVTSHLASLPEPEGRLRHSQPWLCRDLALIGERALLGVKGPIRSEIRNPKSLCVPFTVHYIILYPLQLYSGIKKLEH